MSLAFQVKSQINIVDLMLKDGLQLKKEGMDRYSCKCPFHNEKTPSFKVDESFQNFKCFGCGIYGDAISYFAQRNTLDYRTATLVLAERLGIKTSDKSMSDFTKQKKLLELVSELETFYKNKFTELSEYHPAKQQILKRDLKIEGYEDYFGYAPSSPTEMINYMKSKGYTIDDLKEIGVVNEKDNVQLRDRLIFFIRNYLGKTVGFSGRALTKDDNGFKYVNSKNSIVFDKSKVLYNIEKAKKSAKDKNEIYLVEGQFDVLAMVQNGLENTVAISGTALTNQHINTFKRCLDESGRIILCLDGDSAGRNAAIKVFQNFPIIQNQLYIIQFPDGKDPCEFIQENSVDSIPKPVKLIELMFNGLKRKYPPNVIANRQNFIDAVQNEITQYIEQDSLKEVYLNAACATVGISLDGVNKKTFKRRPENTEVNSEIKLPREDVIYINSIAIYIKNKDLLDEINEEKYPPRYREYIKKIKANTTESLIPEELEDEKLTKVILMQNVKKLDDKDLAQEYYNSILKLAHKETYSLKLRDKRVKVVNTLDGLDEDQFLSAIKLLEGGG